MKSPPKLPQFMLPSNSGATPRGTWGRLTRMLTPLVGPVRTATALEQKDEKKCRIFNIRWPHKWKERNRLVHITDHDKWRNIEAK